MVNRLLSDSVGHFARTKNIVMSSRQPYSSPQLQRRTYEQAVIFLTGHAWIGNQGARDLLERIFPPMQGKTDKPCKL